MLPLPPLPSNKSRTYSIVFFFFNLVTPTRITISGICKSPQIRFLIVWSSHIYFPLSQSSVTNSMQLQPTCKSCLQYFRSEPYLMSCQASTVGPAFAKIVNMFRHFLKLFSRKSFIMNI